MNSNMNCGQHGHKEIFSLCEFSISEKNYFLPKGYYLARDLKRIASIPPSHILAEIRGQTIDDLADDCAVLVHDGVKFESYPGKGQNS